MPTGGPASFGVGLFEGLARSRYGAQSRMREQLNEALRLQKEDRESKEAIAKHGLDYEKAKAEAAQAQSELDLIQQRRAQIMASPGKPFRDAGLEGNLEKARERMADAHSALQESQGKLQGLIEDRDARIRSAIPQRKEPATGLGGYFGIGSPESVLPPEQQFGGKGRSDEQVAADKAEIVKRETEHTPENRDSARSVSEAQRETRKYRDEESRERGNIGSAERALEVGRAEQGPQNEEARQAKLFPLDEQSSKLRAKQLEAQSGMAAAAQEIQARQQQRAAEQSQPGYAQAMRGGSATGKGGGGGGLLGAITGKGGAGGAPAPQGQSVGSPGVPTVGQAIGPAIGKIAQMPVNQVAQAARELIGGALGGRSAAPQGVGQQASPGLGSPTGPGGAPIPPQRPQFNQPQSFAGPRQPVWVPVPSVALQGQGGGLTPMASNIAAFRNNNPGNVSLPIAGWHGGGEIVGLKDQPGYARFPDMQTGMAAFKQRLSDYIDSKGLRTIGELNSKYATDKNWGAGVSRASGLGLNTPLDTSNPEQMSALQRGVIKQETGKDVTQPSTRAPQSSVASATQEQGSQRKQPAKQQQTSAPPVPDVYHPSENQPIDIKPFAPQPMPQQGAPPEQPQSMRASNMNQGVPMIHSPDQLKGMKPGSLFRAPDGSLKIVPLVEARNG